MTKFNANPSQNHKHHQTGLKGLIFFLLTNKTDDYDYTISNINEKLLQCTK